MKRCYYSANGTDKDDDDHGSMIGHVFARDSSNAVDTIPHVIFTTSLRGRNFCSSQSHVAL